MTVPITVNGAVIDVPSSAADTNWAAKQVAFEQAMAAWCAALDAALALLRQYQTLQTFAAPLSAATQGTIRFQGGSFQFSENTAYYRRVLPASSVNVHDFGAKGDGTTDDAAAIQAAIAAAALGKKQVLFDALTYKVNSEISLPEDGLELIGVGTANSQYTVLKAGASIRSVVYSGASYLKVSGIQLDANRQATYATFVENCSFSQFNNVKFLNAKVDGINVSVVGINDGNSFVDCWSASNGKVWCTSGLTSYFSDYTEGVATGTVACTSGDVHIVGTGTNFLSMGIRSGDFLRMGTGLDGDQFLQIVTVSDNTHLTVGAQKTPTANLSGQNYGIAVGNGYRETRHNDNNITRIVHGLWRLNAGAGMSFNGLYGPKVDHPQIDLNGFYGVVLGTTDQEITYASSIDHPYFEGNLAAPFLFGAALGVSVVQPEYGQGNLKYHIALATQNVGIWEDYDGAQAIGNAVSSVPATISAASGFTINGALISRAEARVPVAGTSIVPSPHFLLISSGSNVVMTATPTIAAGTVGQEVIFFNQSAGSLTLKDESVLTGSGLHLNTGTVVLGTGQLIRLIYAGGFWTQF